MTRQRRDRTCSQCGNEIVVRIDASRSPRARFSKRGKALTRAPRDHDLCYPCWQEIRARAAEGSVGP